ncbi:MAG: hypothetical protein RR448_06195 [Niameybacter sp.]|uniref:hypothetical protein n=1 Tax=Niameybacter sp. TaxID=2033640 RepID=UPI002FC7BB1B
MDKMYKNDDVSLNELIQVTKDFIELADSLYSRGKITEIEYNELTFVKKDFLAQAEANKENIEVC